MEIIRELKPKGVFIIPKDVRDQVQIRERDKLAVSVKGRYILIRKQEDPKEWLQKFLRFRKKGKSMTLLELKKIEEESYDLS